MVPGQLAQDRTWLGFYQQEWEQASALEQKLCTIIE